MPRSPTWYFWAGSFLWVLRNSPSKPFSFMVARIGSNFLRGTLKKAWRQGRALPTSYSTSDSPGSSIPPCRATSNCIPQAQPPCPLCLSLCLCVCLPLAPALAPAPSVSLCLYVSFPRSVPLFLSPSASLFPSPSLQSSSQDLLHDSENKYLPRCMPTSHLEGLHPILALCSQISHKFLPWKGRRTLAISPGRICALFLCKLYVQCRA